MVGDLNFSVDIYLLTAIFINYIIVGWKILSSSQ